MILNFWEALESIELQSVLFSIYPENMHHLIKVKFRCSDLRDYLKNGYKFCSQCYFIVKTTERKCRNCGKMFRTRVRRNSGKNIRFFSEPKNKIHFFNLGDDRF